MYIVLHLYYTTSMKTSKTFRLSEEAVRILESKENATEYLEALIMNSSTTALTEERVRAIIEEELSARNSDLVRNDDLASLGLRSAESFTPRPPDPVTGYPCCQKSSPCKHWVWDDIETAYINNLTGELREV